MSLLSSIVLPWVEKQIIAAEPKIAADIFKELHGFCQEAFSYFDKKIGVQSKDNQSIEGI